MIRPRCASCGIKVGNRPVISFKSKLTCRKINWHAECAVSDELVKLLTEENLDHIIDTIDGRGLGRVL